MIKFLDLAAQYESLKTEIDSAIANVIQDTAFIGGKYVKKFEQEFADYIGAKFCIGVANGTDALEIAIEAAQFPPGSEIIVPGNSFIASSEAITRCGHKVVFADVDHGCYTLTAETVRSKITDRTKAIIAVHIYGHPCDMNALLEICNEGGLILIEDCAQAHGAQYMKQSVGTFGHFAAFSFYPGKNLGAYGDAGALTTQDEELATRSRKIANHGRITKYDHEFEGRNSRLDGLQAAILSAKLPHLESWTQHRIKIANYYLVQLADIEGLILPERKPWARQVYHLFVVRSNRRDELKNYLAERGIETGVHYPIALPKLNAYSYLGVPDNDAFYNQTDTALLSLPIGEHIDMDMAGEVVSVVRNFFASHDEK
jgi:dTDP-4-amino-4,6-dideoxygalactose transaminase